MTADTPSKCRLCGKLTKSYYDFCEECVQAEAKRKLDQLAGSQVDPTPEMQAAADACLADTPSSRDEEIPTPMAEVLKIANEQMRECGCRPGSFIYGCTHAVRRLRAALIRLSAEREKEGLVANRDVPTLFPTLQSEIKSLRATLAERDKELAEAKAELSEYKRREQSQFELEQEGDMEK